MPDAGHEVVVLVGGVAVNDAVKVGEVPEMGKKKNILKETYYWPSVFKCFKKIFF